MHQREYGGFSLTEYRGLKHVTKTVCSSPNLVPVNVTSFENVDLVDAIK